MHVEKVSNYIIDWLRDYAQKSKAKGFVVGVSGGIDSAVTSTLCAKTGLLTLCLEMPIHQAENQVSRAQNHIKWLHESFKNVSSQRVNLTPVFEEFKESVPHVDNEGDLFLTLANTRARLRMTTLYYFAGLHNRLVAGTGNKVEDFGVGFYTKYGDGGVDISPIADLMKSEVFAIGEIFDINKDIQTATPTDGLWGDNRTDEDQIGASYDELEWAMCMQEIHKKPSDFEGRNKVVYENYLKLNTTNQHKMNPIPVCTIPDELKG